MLNYNLYIYISKSILSTHINIYTDHILKRHQFLMKYAFDCQEIKELYKSHN